MTDDKKQRKALGPVEIYSDDDGVRTKLDLEVPANLKSTDAIVRWLKSNAQVDGVYAIQRTLGKVRITQSLVKSVSAELV